MAKTKIAIPKSWLIAPAVITLIFLLWGSHELYTINRLHYSGRTTVASCIWGGRGVSRYQFFDENGTNYQFNELVLFPCYGGAVNVFYDPQNPQTAVVDSSQEIGLALFATIFGLIGSGAVLAAFIVTMRRDTKARRN